MMLVGPPGPRAPAKTEAESVPQKLTFIPNSIARGAPKPNTPVPAPTRLAIRFAGIVPFTDPGAPVRRPLITLGGRSKLTNWNRLKNPTLGSIAKRSPHLWTQLAFKSKARNAP